jgi:hypothetical protein
MERWATTYLKQAFVIPAAAAFAAGPGLMSYDVGRITAGPTAKDRLKLMGEEMSPSMAASTAGAVLAPIIGSIGGYELGHHFATGHEDMGGLIGGTLGGGAGLVASNALGRAQGRNTLES